MKKRTYMLVCLGALAVTAALGAAGWFLLPEQVGMQIGISGQLQNYMPKAVAVLAPVGVCLLGTGLCAANEERRTAGMILAAAAPVLSVITLLMNR